MVSKYANDVPSPRVTETRLWLPKPGEPEAEWPPENMWPFPQVESSDSDSPTRYERLFVSLNTSSHLYSLNTLIQHCANKKWPLPKVVIWSWKLSESTVRRAMSTAPIWHGEPNVQEIERMFLTANTRIGTNSNNEVNVLQEIEDVFKFPTTSPVG